MCDAHEAIVITAAAGSSRSRMIHDALMCSFSCASGRSNVVVLLREKCVCMRVYTCRSVVVGQDVKNKKKRPTEGLAD